MTNSRVTQQGQAMGALTAKLANRGLRRLESMGLAAVEGAGLRGQMCKTCACRPGSVPNGCLQTQLDFLKAAAEGEKFLCHSPMNGKLCAGWAQVRAELVANPLPKRVIALIDKHEYSPPDEPEARIK